MIRMIYLQLPNCHYQQTVQQQLLPYSSYLMIFAFSLMVPNQTDFFFLFSPVGCLNHCPYHMWMLFLRGKTHCLFPLNAKFLPLLQGPYLKYLDREAVEWVSGLLSFMPWYGLYWKKKKRLLMSKHGWTLSCLGSVLEAQESLRHWPYLLSPMGTDQH